MSANKRKVLLVVAIVILTIAIVSVLPTRTNFFFAGEEEKRQINEFYLFQPEMISEGSFFDLKLLTPYTMTPSNIGGAYYMWISILKKVDTNMKFTTEIEFFYQGKRVEANYIRHFNETFDDVSWLDSMIHSRGNRYYYPNFLIWIFDNDVEYVTRIDEIKMTISYLWGKETHYLKFDADSSERLVNEVIKSHLENPNADDRYIRAYYRNFFEALQMYDFERWYVSVKDTIDKCANEKDELSCYVIKNGLLSTLSPRQEEVLLSSEQSARLLDFITRYRNIRDVLRSE